MFESEIFFTNRYNCFEREEPDNVHCDQIGHFKAFLPTPFITKVAQIFGAVSGLFWKHHSFSIGSSVTGWSN